MSGELVGRAQAFDAALRQELVREGRAVPPGIRSIAGFALCIAALEHGSGVRELFRDDNPGSAYALVRVQFEAILRAAWITFAAPEDWLELFGSPVGEAEANEPAEFPKVYQMLDQLEASAVTPNNLHYSLSTLKIKAWKAMNSYTHGGLRAVSRVLNGFEPELDVWMLRTSSSLSYVSCQLCAFIVKDPSISQRVNSIRAQFSDCMHA